MNIPPRQEARCNQQGRALLALCPPLSKRHLSHFGQSSLFFLNFPPISEFLLHKNRPFGNSRKKVRGSPGLRKRILPSGGLDLVAGGCGPLVPGTLLPRGSQKTSGVFQVKRRCPDPWWDLDLMTYRVQAPSAAVLRGLDASAGARGTLHPHGVSSLSRPWSFPPCPATQGWKGAGGGVLSCCFLRGTLATGHATHRASRERARCGGRRLLCWLWAPSITPPTSGCESAGSRQGSLPPFLSHPVVKAQGNSNSSGAIRNPGTISHQP